MWRACPGTPAPAKHQQLLTPPTAVRPTPDELNARHAAIETKPETLGKDLLCEGLDTVQALVDICDSSLMMDRLGG